MQGRIEYDVKHFVQKRGYGPWYQREAWEYVKNSPVFYIIQTLEYLDKRYPQLDFEGE